jgi:hypothetical protein
VTTSLDTEFETFKAKLHAELIYACGKKRTKVIDRLCADPELRQAFVRSVFAADPLLPDIWNIRRRLRGR